MGYMYETTLGRYILYWYRELPGGGMEFLIYHDDNSTLWKFQREKNSRASPSLPCNWLIQQGISVFSWNTTVIEMTVEISKNLRAV